MTDILTMDCTGTVDSELVTGKKVASFKVEVDAPGGKMKVLIRVAITQPFHLIVPKGSNVSVFKAEIYKTEKTDEYDIAAYIRDPKQIIPGGAPYKGEKSADSLMEKDKGGTFV